MCNGTCTSWAAKSFNDPDGVKGVKDESGERDAEDGLEDEGERAVGERTTFGVKPSVGGASVLMSVRGITSWPGVSGRSRRREEGSRGWGEVEASAAAK
jgi:hypothetical protein